MGHARADSNPNHVFESEAERLRYIRNVDEVGSDLEKEHDVQALAHTLAYAQLGENERKLQQEIEHSLTNDKTADFRTYQMANHDPYNSHQFMNAAM